MNIQEAIGYQRVRHIVSSYRLDGTDKSFQSYLDRLLLIYPAPLVELALVETLVDAWLHLPAMRGFEFLLHAQTKLMYWEDEPIVSTITAEQFQAISGLDPSPIFGRSPATVSDASITSFQL
jgi:hypothetical protein